MVMAGISWVLNVQPYVKGFMCMISYNPSNLITIPLQCVIVFNKFIQTTVYRLLNRGKESSEEATAVVLGMREWGSESYRPP